MSNSVFRIVSLACWGVAVISLAFGTQIGMQHLLSNIPNVPAVGVKALACVAIMVMATVTSLVENGFTSLRIWLKMSWGWSLGETLFDGACVMTTTFLAAFCGTIMFAGYQYLPWWGAIIVTLVTIAVGMWPWHLITEALRAPNTEERTILVGTFVSVMMVFTAPINAATFVGGCIGIIAMAGIYVLLEMRKTAGAKTATN